MSPDLDHIACGGMQAPTYGSSSYDGDGPHHPLEDIVRFIIPGCVLLWIFWLGLSTWFSPYSWCPWYNHIELWALLVLILYCFGGAMERIVNYDKHLEEYNEKSQVERQESHQI